MWKGPKIKLSSCLLSNVFGNRFWKDFGIGMDAFLGTNWPSEATSKASVIKYANQEGPKSFGTLLSPREIFGFCSPVRADREGISLTRFIPLRLKPTGSADW